MSFFENVEESPPIEIFELNKLYKEDKFDKKIDLGIGAYRTNDGLPCILPAVEKAQKLIIEDNKNNFEYLPISGLEEFSRKATSILLGENSNIIQEGRFISFQTLSGTGAIRLAADFLKKCCNFDTVYISNPSWPNHNLIFKHAGYSNIKYYSYWDVERRALNFDGLITDLTNAPERSIIILHVCAHNPTGVDPTEEQWNRIADLIKQKNHFPLFDCAYQGFASGDLDKDAYSIRLFASKNFEFIACQSFAKNFGLYNQRVGNLVCAVHDKSKLLNIQTQLSTIVRANYSNPPAHGARIVLKILSKPELVSEWHENIKTMSKRIIEMRIELRTKLEELKTPGDWQHITSQIGMFSYTGLTAKQVLHLVEKYHIYLIKAGRISICGINSHNVGYLAQAINETVKNIN